MKSQPHLSAHVEDAITQYKRNGYYIARQLLPEPSVKRVFSDIHHLAVQQLHHYGLPYHDEHTRETLHSDLQALFTKDIKTYLATLTLTSKLISLYGLFMEPALLDFIKYLGLSIPVWQTGPIVHLMSTALKIPGGYYGFGLHQDWPSQQGGLDGVTVWIPLADVDRKMFTMEVIPGSHLQGLYPSTKNDQILEINPAFYDENALVPIEAKRGDVVFMSAFMLHRSSTVGDERLRLSTSIRFENAAEPHFIARNYPSAQKRSANQDLITPDFPTAEQMREIFK